MTITYNSVIFKNLGFAAYNIRHTLVPAGLIPQVVVPYHDGVFQFERFHAARAISMDYCIQDQREGVVLPDPRKLYDSVATALRYRTPKELMFETEPDRFYRAILGTPAAGFGWRGAFAAQGSMEFFCSDPFGYSINDQVYGTLFPAAVNHTTDPDNHVVFDTVGSPPPLGVVGGTVECEPTITIQIGNFNGSYDLTILNNSNGEMAGYENFAAQAGGGPGGNEKLIRLVTSSWRWQIWNTDDAEWVDSMAGATGGFPRLVPGEINTLTIGGFSLGWVQVDYTPRFL